MRLLAGGPILGLILILGLATPVLAQSDAAACSAIVDDAARLACYDGIFRPGASQDLNAITIASERLIPAQPTGRKPALMVVSCEAGAVAVRFSFAGQVISATSDVAPIAFQIDQSPTSIRSLATTDKTTEIEFQSTGEATAFLDTLAGASNLKVRVTPIRQRSLTVDFKLGADAEAIRSLRDSCR